MSPVGGFTILEPKREDELGSLRKILGEEVLEAIGLL
jgi:hypothetical protein